MLEVGGVLELVENKVQGFPRKPWRICSGMGVVVLVGVEAGVAIGLELLQRGDEMLNRPLAGKGDGGYGCGSWSWLCGRVVDRNLELLIVFVCC